MNRRNHRTFLRVEELERRDVPSSGLVGMGTTLVSGQDGGEVNLVRLRRIVTDAMTAPGQVQGIAMTSFQWGIGR